MRSHVTFQVPHFAGRSGLALLLAMAAVLGALGFAFYFGGQQIDRYAYAGMLVFVAFAFTVLANPSTRVSIGPLGCLLLGFVAWNGVSTIWSSVPYTSLIDLGMLLPAAVIYLVWRIWNDDRSILPTEFLLVALGLGFGALLWAQHYMGYRPQAMFLNPNSAAGLLNFAWPFAAIAWLDRERKARERAFALLAVFLIVSALMLGGSRGALLGALAGVGLTAFVGLSALRQPRGTVLLLATFAVALLVSNAAGDGAIASGTASLGNPAAAGADRFAIWTSAWEMVSQHPWLGYGPGVFWQAYSAYRSASEGSSGYWVHNDYLEFWIETGIFGLALILAIGIACAVLFAAAVRGYRRKQLARNKVELATACLAAIVAVASHSFFTFNLQLMSFLLILGILIAELERACPSRPWLTPRIPSMRRILPAVSLIALATLIVGHYARTAAVLRGAERGEELMQQGEYVEAANAFTRAQSLWSQFDPAWYLNANVIYEALQAHGVADDKRAELIGQANDMLDRAERYNPHRAATPLIRGLLRANHPDVTTGSAEAALQRAIELAPRSIEARYALSQVLEREGETERAREALERGINIARAAHMDGRPLARRLRELQARTASESGRASVDSIRLQSSDPPITLEPR